LQRLTQPLLDRGTEYRRYQLVPAFSDLRDNPLRGDVEPETLECLTPGLDVSGIGIH
jgi:hypothetical protein